MIVAQRSLSGSPLGSPATTADMLAFAARHGIAPVTETFPLSKVNEALDHLRAGKARYRIVLENDLANSLPNQPATPWRAALKALTRHRYSTYSSPQSWIPGNSYERGFSRYGSHPVEVAVCRQKFDAAKKIAPELWARLEQAPVLAPSSYGLQPWKFIVVTNPEVRKQLHPVSYNQSQILDASHLVVFAAKNPPTPADVERHVARTAQVRGLLPAVLDGMKKRMLGSLSDMTEKDAHNWAAADVYRPGILSLRVRARGRRCLPDGGLPA